MQEKEYDNELFHRWLEGAELTADETEQLKADPDFIIFEKINGTVSNWSVPTPDVSSSFDRLMEKRQQEAKVVPLFTQKKLWALAASVLLLVGCFIVFQYMVNGGQNVYSVALGEDKTITLPDGSTAALHGPAMVSYSEDDWKDVRKLEADGAVYFEVKKGSSFKVILDEGQVQTIGTRFETRNSEKGFSVLCYQGKVKVESTTKSNEGIFLTQGQAVKYAEERGFETYGIPGADKPLWSGGKVSEYKNAPLEEVIHALSLQYDVTFDASEIDLNRKFSGTFVNTNLTVALKMVFDPLRIAYDINGKKITLSQK